MFVRELAYRVDIWFEDLDLERIGEKVRDILLTINLEDVVNPATGRVIRESQEFQNLARDLNRVFFRIGVSQIDNFIILLRERSKLLVSVVEDLRREQRE